MSEPVTQVAKTAVAGIREALAVGKEIESVTKDIQDLGKADLQARASFRRKQKQRPSDTSVFLAVEEWRGVYGEECYIDKSYGNGYEHDIIFVGSKGYHPEYPYRPMLIDYLKQTYGKRFLHVGGDGDTGTIRGDKLNRIYAKSKIAIGDSLNLNFDYPYYTSDRLFESTGRGGFTIYPDIKGLRDLFVDKEEIVFYEHGNFKDLKNKIEYYLEHNEEREKIRLSGHERTKREHTYVHRWQTILGELSI